MPEAHDPPPREETLSDLDSDVDEYILSEKEVRNLFLHTMYYSIIIIILYSGKIWQFGEFVGKNCQIKTSPITHVTLSRNAHVFVSPNLKFANMFW